MKKVKWLLVIGSLGMSFLAGCAEEPAQYTDKLCLPAAEQKPAMTAAEDVLAKMHFTIDKSDAEYGFIRTRPLRAGQSFEFWRKDNVGEFNSAEANLHTIRRTAEMNFNKQDGQLCIECVTRVERLSMPERETVSTSSAAGLFTKSGGKTQRLKLYPDQQEQMRWIDLGRDNALETEILRQLKAKL